MPILTVSLYLIIILQFFYQLFKWLTLAHFLALWSNIIFSKSPLWPAFCSKLITLTLFLPHHLSYFLMPFISTCNVMDSMDWSAQPPVYPSYRLPSYTTETRELTATLPRHLCNRILDETKYYMTFGTYKGGAGYLCPAFIDQQFSRDENAKTLWRRLNFMFQYILFSFMNVRGNSSGNPASWVQMNNIRVLLNITAPVAGLRFSFSQPFDQFCIAFLY